MQSTSNGTWYLALAGVVLAGAAFAGGAYYAQKGGTLPLPGFAPERRFERGLVVGRGDSALEVRLLSGATITIPFVPVQAAPVPVLRVTQPARAQLADIAEGASVIVRFDNGVPAQVQDLGAQPAQ